MSLLDFAVNEQLEAFGFPWHGLFVAPIACASYVELASGRRIYSDSFTTEYISPNTFLVDLGLPIPTLQPEDVQAKLWNKYIASGIPGSDYFSAWGGIPGSNLRRVRVGDELPVISISPSRSVFSGLRIMVELYFSNRSSSFKVSIPAAALVSLPDTYSQWELLDVTPDGRKWIIAFERETYSPIYPYQIRVDIPDDEGIGAIFELSLAEDFASGTLSMLADFESCALGTNVSEVNGQDLSKSEFWVVTTESDGWIEWGESEPPTPPYRGTLEPFGPYKAGATYAHGESTSSAKRDLVIGAWYSATGDAQLVSARISTTRTLSASTPIEGAGNKWWSPFTETYLYDVKVKIGAGSYWPFFSAGGSITKTPAITTYEMFIGGEARTVTKANTASDAGSAGPFAEIVSFGKAPQDSAPRSSASGSGARPDDALLIWYTGFQSSNKVLSCMARYTVGTDESLVFEYIAGPAVSPAGVDNKTVTTGNLVPGHDRTKPGFSKLLWDYHGTFSIGAHNPVTGAVERQRLGGDYFTWV